MENDFLFGSDLTPKWAEVFQPESFKKEPGIVGTNFDAQTYDHILTIYPKMRAGLELCCGNGRRIRGGRSAMKNIFGINEKPLEMMWKLNKVDDFCKVGTVDEIPYKDNTFDFICYPIPIKKSKKYLREMKRVCNGRWYLQLNGEVPDTDWINLLTNEGYYIDVFHKSDGGHYVSEGKFLRGNK